MGGCAPGRRAVRLGAGLAHYSGEDMPEKASMMAWSDVFLTVYSTMVVETAIHDRPRRESRSRQEMKPISRQPARIR